jgi:hypothetical protein
MRWRVALTAIGVISTAVALSVIATSPPANGQCAASGTLHVVTIRNNAVIPEHTSAKLCDRLIIKNLDKNSRLIAFGLHEEHVPYDGVSERLLGQNESFTVTLSQTGDFRFHDHLQDEVQGTFTVAAN